ncbi:MAG: GxxExxY protein [Gammaproteobacteria bacterium]|nr:GxxExxY protein [Gammaproteobacteria bacterium]
MDENELSYEVIGAAIEVHQNLGPGLLEAVYQQCLYHELELRQLEVCSEVPVNARYKGVDFDTAYRMDLVVSDKLVIELKVVEKFIPVHDAQLLSYLRLTGKKLGLLINFNVPVLTKGIKRVVNNL